jgi:hypothetical protein
MQYVKTDRPGRPITRFIYLCDALMMIINRIHTGSQFARLSVRLPADIRAKGQGDSLWRSVAIGSYAVLPLVGKIFCELP